MPKRKNQHVSVPLGWEKYADLYFLPPTEDELKEDWPELINDPFLVVHAELLVYGCTRGALYVRLRLAGASHNLALMVAHQRTPAIRTDATFFQFSKPLSEQFVSARQMRKVISTARQHGYNPGQNDQYLPQLARFQGDPEAFVPPSGGRSYIKKLLAKRGWQCDGAVETPYREPEVDPWEKKRMAADLLQKNTEELTKHDPHVAKLLAKGDRKQAREAVLAKFGRNS